MSNKVIVQSVAGEVRIEAEVKDGKTVFTTYVLNTRQHALDENEKPANACEPRGIAAYYARKVKNDIRPLLTEKESTANRADQILSELISDMC